MSDENRNLLDKIIVHAEQIGNLKARQDSLDGRMNSIEQSLKDSIDRFSDAQDNLNDKVDELIQTNQELRGQISGGWKVITVGGGLAISFGAFFAWVIDKWDTIKNAIL